MCTHTMRSITCVSVFVCVARKLHPCPSYSRCRDRINLGLWRSLYKAAGGGGYLWRLMICGGIHRHLAGELGKRLVCGGVGLGGRGLLELLTLGG